MLTNILWEGVKMFASGGFGLTADTPIPDKPKGDDPPEVRQAYYDSITANNPSRKTRRWVAIIVANVWAISSLVLLGCAVLGRAITSDMWEMMGQVNIAFMLVLGFYFSKGVIDNAVNRYMTGKEQGDRGK